ncbi:MAG: hypothetical protein ACHQF2_09270 [Flavobacteriales bacterium]
MKKHLFLLVLLVFVLPSTLFAQDDSTQVDNKIYVVVKNDGTEYVGKIIKKDDREVLIETKKLGRIYIPKHEIKEIREINERDIDRDGDFKSEESFATRYFLTTNGLSVGRKQSYILWNLYGPDFQFGVGEKFSVGFMTSWLGIPLVGTAKYSITLGSSVHLGIGALAGTGSWAAFDYGVALPFASLTFGSKRSNLSITGGYGLAFGDGNSEGRLMFSIAGMAKVSKKVSLIFDSFMVPQQTAGGVGGGLIIPGVRFHTGRDRAFQFGFAGLYFDGEIIPFPIPMVGWFTKL